MQRLSFVPLLLALLAVVSCSPTPQSLEVTRIVSETSPVEVTRLVEIEVTRLLEVTRPVEVEVTRVVEVTPGPTNTPPPTSDEQREEFLAWLISTLESSEEVERVNLVRYGEGTVEAELFTIWASSDSQPNVSWSIVTTLAEELKDLEPEQSMFLTGSENLSFVLTTFSTEGDYRYQSRTDLETFKKLAARQMSLDEWTAAAEAGFK